MSLSPPLRVKNSSVNPFVIQKSQPVRFSVPCLCYVGDISDPLLEGLPCSLSCTEHGFANPTT